MIKVVTYGIMHMVVAILVAYILSGNWVIALGIGLIEPAVQTVCYHFHERAWSHIEHAQPQMAVAKNLRHIC